MGTDNRPTALVTGASGGIGRDLAELAAADGFDVVLVARSADVLGAAADDIEERHGVRALAVPADLADPQAPARLAAELAGRGVAVDVLVNNAGVGAYGEFVDSDPEAQLAMIRVNVGAVVGLTRALLPPMVERGRGRILNVASTAAFQPGPLMAVYYATKAFVLSFSEALAEELAGTGVTVTALCPGPTRSSFQDRAGMQKSRLFRLARVMDSMPVARRGWRAALRGRRVVIPGLFNRAMAQSVRLAPRRLVTALVRRIQSPSE